MSRGANNHSIILTAAGVNLTMRNIAPVAQWTEHRSSKPLVAGSSPARGALFAIMRAADHYAVMSLKSCLKSAEIETLFPRAHFSNERKWATVSARLPKRTYMLSSFVCNASLA